MDRDAVKEILDVLFSNMEKLETETEGIKQFLKEKKKVTDAQLAPYMEQAGKTSNVKWRAARVRIEYLIAGMEQAEQKKHERDREQKPEISTQQGNTVEGPNPGPWGQGIGQKESSPQKREQEGPSEAVESRDSGDSRERGRETDKSKRDERHPANSEPETKVHMEQEREPAGEAEKPDKSNEQKKDSDQEAA